MKKLNTNKSFGLFFGFFLLILFIYFYFKKENLNFYLIISSATFFILGFLNSNLLTPLNKIWIKFGDLLGKITSPIIIGIMYFLVVFPTKIIITIFNKDILDLNLNKETKTYWKKKEKMANSMDNQF